jgi:hypothetical protein
MCDLELRSESLTISCLEGKGQNGANLIVSFLFILWEAYWDLPPRAAAKNGGGYCTADLANVCTERHVCQQTSVAKTRIGWRWLTKFARYHDDKTIHSKNGPNMQFSYGHYYKSRPDAK